MKMLDWIVLLGTLGLIVGYGTWKTRNNKNIDEYIKGGNRAKWWTIGLSVMATQASAITFLSTPGQAYIDGMEFIQIYFGMPIAIVIICLVFIPVYHKLKVYTAYEFLENRFDLKTRTLAAIIFLIQRGLAAGITIFAPAIILSSILGWDLKLLNTIIGILVIIYTVSGGTKAVSVTQKQQMFVIMLGMIIAFFLLISYLPADLKFQDALYIAGASDKLNILKFDVDSRYNLWSGILGGTFLSLSYFGTDQSQVQRYLSGKSISQMRWGLLFNGLLKIPMQFFILLVGTMVFVFFLFQETPLNFNPKAEEFMLNSSNKIKYELLQNKLNTIKKDRKGIALNYANKSQNPNKDISLELKRLNLEERNIRRQSQELIKNTTSIESNDKDYVFLHFVLNYLPNGLIGLLLAVIISAAMSSTASEINALGTITAIDLYKRNVEGKSEKHYIVISKWFTLLWGAIAIFFANISTLFENLIQLVNIIGSIFYGSILGIVLVALFTKNVKGNVIFFTGLFVQLFVIGLYYYLIYLPSSIGQVEKLSYLYLNIIGTCLVFFVSLIVQYIISKNNKNKVFDS